MGRDFVGRNIQAVVKLDFIRVYDFGVREMAGAQVDGQPGLSGGGGAHDDDEFGGLVLIGGVMVVGGAVHPGPPWTAVEV